VLQEHGRGVAVRAPSSVMGTAEAYCPQAVPRREHTAMLQKVERGWQGRLGGRRSSDLEGREGREREKT
jgi:hypothetical protein